ncbi:hypothetical protein QFZ66_008001 [Streptomyces sp. B4I13]|uniref:hypothetical protein n=1 Tax=Streptomyces sp. B4I13 TaxID=3042271 RepID=UPI0027800202|nr:hypothetical protein [Streptomyces sp. B4I13]MDQ0964123.1 hypothetical protein [Streptomyces sp. B4I13]
MRVTAAAATGFSSIPGSGRQRAAVMLKALPAGLALVTLVATAFAQIAPASWQLAEARIVDVVTGSVIGLLCAMLAWPAGARREVARTMAGLLRECRPLIDGTLAVLTAVPPGSARLPPTLPALHRMRLAESAYAQFRSEPGAGASVGADWHSVLIATHQILLGAHWLPRFDLPPDPLPPAAVARARADARSAVTTVGRLTALCAGAPPPTAGGQPPSADRPRRRTEPRPRTGHRPRRRCRRWSTSRSG